MIYRWLGAGEGTYIGHVLMLVMLCENHFKYKYMHDEYLIECNLTTQRSMTVKNYINSYKERFELEYFSIQKMSFEIIECTFKYWMFYWKHHH